MHKKLSYKEQLLQLLDELDRNIQNNKEATDTVMLDQTRMGRLSRMDALQNQMISKNLKQRKQQKKREIGLALERVKNGTYGICMNCGEAISENRLTVNLTAKLCIECA